LLIGSGVSRSAEIPTGWEIVKDLVRQLAELMDYNHDLDPLDWYREQFGTEPNYSFLLEKLAKSRAERQVLLRKYFEPTGDERERGLKQPQKAHRAIADLVRDGYVKVIVTTNFDHLLEDAIREINIEPTVLSTYSLFESALPIEHNSNCTIIKVNGDYLDTQIRNTTGELERYKPSLNSLLQRIFSDYGLIICGWSAQWDIALRSELEKNRRQIFTTYWTNTSSLDENALRIARLRNAEIIEISNADSFFGQLKENIDALDRVNSTHPLVTKTVVSRMKKYLEKEGYEITLNDFVDEETERLYEKLSFEHFPTNRDLYSQDEVKDRIKKYEALSETLISIMLTGCYWGKENQNELWVRLLQRIANPIGRSNNDSVDLMNLRLYPALLLLFTGSISSIIKGKHLTFASLVRDVKTRYLDNRETPAVLEINTTNVLDYNLAKQVLNLSNFAQPLSEHIFHFLRDPFREYVKDDLDYERYFDIFEYLFSLVYADYYEKIGTYLGGTIGCFGRRAREGRYGTYNVMKEVEKEIEIQKNDWVLLKCGFFDSSLERLKSIKKELDDCVMGRR